jgi:hypothetical protein
MCKDFRICRHLALGLHLRSLSLGSPPLHVSTRRPENVGHPCGSDDSVVLWIVSPKPAVAAQDGVGIEPIQRE